MKLGITRYYVIISATNGVLHGAGTASSVTTQLNSTLPFTNLVSPDASSTVGEKPKAYLKVLFFDERFNFVPAADGGVSQIQVAASVTSDGSLLPLSDIKAPKNAYAYVYVSNQSNNDVYFDNLKVAVTTGNIIEESHYYSYGLKMAGISSKKPGDNYEGQLKNSYLYQGVYAELDDDIGWTDFALRNYDAQIGRWIQQDPYQQFASPYVGMGDDPVNTTDPSGGVSWPPPGLSTLSTTAATAITLGEVVVRSVSSAARAVSSVSMVMKMANLTAKVFQAANVINNAFNSFKIGGAFQGIRSFTGTEVMALVKNSMEGLNTPGRNGSLDCLNAFASNLKALYGANAPDKLPTDGNMATPLTQLIDGDLARLKRVVQPKVDGKKLSSRSHSGSEYYDGDHFTGEIKNNILEDITSHTGYENIGIFAVGLGAQYHSTIIVVSKNPKFTITANGKSYTGSETDPFYIFVEDNGGARFGNAGEMDKILNPYISGARAYYRGQISPGGRGFPTPEKDMNLGTTIYDLFQKL